MLGFKYFQGHPNEFVSHISGGRVKRQGISQSFYYFAPWSSLSVVPLQSIDLPFMFEESTLDYQVVTAQGQLTFKVKDPVAILRRLNLVIDAQGKYIRDDFKLFKERVVSSAQTVIRNYFREFSLKDALNQGSEFSRLILSHVQAANFVSVMGVEIIDLNITSIRPTPEMSRALEAGARESLQQKADEAIYLRRNSAVDNERLIKDNELQTELAIAQKKREIKAADLQGQIALETERAKLIEQRVANEKREADAKAYSLEATIKPIRDIDWRLLMSLNQGAIDPKNMIAFAFRELAENAHKIGELNISPDLLKSLIEDRK